MMTYSVIDFCGFVSEKNIIVWDIGKKSKLPCPEGESVVIEVIGEYADDDISLLIVKIVFHTGTVLTHKPNGSILYSVKSNEKNFSSEVIDKIIKEKDWQKKHFKFKYIAYAEFYHKDVSLLHIFKK